MDNSNHNVFFKNLDALRFLAFFSVFICHTFIHYSNEFHFISTNLIINNIINFIGDGDKAVSFFFVLSGFLISFLIFQEQKNTQKFVLKNFYIRRFLRIWPLYFLSILIGFVIYPLLKLFLFNIETFQPHNWLYHISFLSNFDLINLYHSNIGTDILMLVINWSLSVEEQFYIAWPLLFIIFKRKQYLFVFFSIVIITILYRLYNINDNITLKYSTFSVMGDLSMGGILAYLSFFKAKFLAFFKSLNRVIIITIYITLLSLLIFENDLFQLEYYSVFKRLLWCVFFAFVICEQNYAKHSILKLSKFKFISKWGKYTYGLYLLHPIAIQIVLIIQKGIIFTSLSVYQKLFFTGLSLILTFILAYFSYHYFELFFLKMKKKYSR